MPKLTAEDSGDVDFEVVCATCGYGLCNVSTVRTYRRAQAVEVEACPRCISKKDDQIQELKDHIQELEANTEE